MAKAAILGFGTVGSGVVQIINNHQDKLMHQVGCPVKIKKILELCVKTKNLILHWTKTVASSNSTKKTANSFWK